MKAIVFALTFALLPGWAAAQEQPKPKKPVPETRKPAQATQKPCAEFGPASSSSEAQIRASKLAAA